MFLCGYYQKTCIRKFLLLVLAVIMLVCSYHTYAQSAPTDTSNGVVVNESPCEPVKGTYENYVDALKKRYTTEYEAARRKAVPMQPVERFVHALYTREEFSVAHQDIKKFAGRLHERWVESRGLYLQTAGHQRQALSSN